MSNYKDRSLNIGPNRLDFAAQDAVSFERYVRAGWSDATSVTVECQTDLNATYANWSAALGRLSQQELDIFVIYLAGHAVLTTENDAAFCFADASGDHGRLGPAEIDNALEVVGADITLLLLDSCHAEAVVAGSIFFRYLKGTRARLFLCSARADQRAWEDASVGHGLFSNAIIRGLASTSPLSSIDGFVEIDSLFTYVSEDVARRAFARKDRARQEPVRGGLSTFTPRLPTASATSLGSQISTYQALATTFRRWLTRAIVATIGIAVITDLSFQHIHVDADGDIVARSGLRVFDAARRILPGGLVDTGLDFTDVDRSGFTDSRILNALEDGQLVTSRLHKYDSWPARIGSILKSDVKQELSILLTGKTDTSVGDAANFNGPPPIGSFALLGMLDPKFVPQIAVEGLGYDVRSSDLACNQDISNLLDFNHLNPSVEKYVAELDWRLATAANDVARRNAYRIAALTTAYRLAVHVRESENQLDASDYGGLDEFRRLAEWAQAPSLRTTFTDLPEKDGWCSFTKVFLVAVSDSLQASNAERILLNTLRNYDSSRTGDLITGEAALALQLLAYVGRHRPLEAATIDGISAFLRTDDRGRGLNGIPDIVQWLAQIAKYMAFPEVTREFLFAALQSPIEEFNFEQLTAYEILACNAQFLTDDQRTQILDWARAHASDYETQDSFVTGSSCLVRFMEEKDVQAFVDAMFARTSIVDATVPRGETWRGDMLIEATDLTEWHAIARIGRTFTLSKDVLDDLLLFASMTESKLARHEAMLALAFQLDFVRAADWSAFRRALARKRDNGDKRQIIARAVGLHICGKEKQEKLASIDGLRSLWSSETIPIIKIGLAQALEQAALCSITKFETIRPTGPNDGA